jgi:hypothetical protein
MPTISQLPATITVSAADELPISQGGIARATSVGVLLASAQPAIIVDALSLLGRTSIGSGGPEQVNIGIGMSLFGGTLVADGLDHGQFPLTSGFSTESDLVISNQGSPMLMQASLLRGLFSAGENVSIDPNGVISTAAGATPENSIGELQVVAGLAAQDLVAISHSGSDYAIAYSNFLDGVTIDQAQAAAPAGDSDTMWVAQGSNVMVSQTLSAIWIWTSNKLPTYKIPIVEITTNTNLDTTVHNGRILVCSQPVTLTPLTTNMGAGFQCTLINASEGNITLGSDFVSSNGNFILTPWQSATLCCATYSAGTIAFAAMPAASTIVTVPGQVAGLLTAGTTTTATTISWQPPSTGGGVASYILESRPTGTASWSTSASVVGATSYLLTGLQPATSYDISVVAQNSIGLGVASAILTVVTASIAQQTVPPQVSGLIATPTSSVAVELSWPVQTGNNAATTFTVQYRVTGSPSWIFSVTGVTGTGDTVSGLQAATTYDFSVIGVNGAGPGPVSGTVTAATLAAAGSVTSITWNLLPNGTYTHGSGTIGINALVSPSTSPIQFGFSISSSTPPSSWTPAILVNANMWGAYVPTPAAAGTWFTWGEGLDSSARTVSPSPFLVQ